MRISLPWNERKVISEVAKFYCDMAIRGEGFDDRIRQFWRISMYVKAGLLYYNDAKTILTAMEEFHNLYKDSPAYKDPNGIYQGMAPAIKNLRALIEKEEAKREKASVSTK